LPTQGPPHLLRPCLLAAVTAHRATMAAEASTATNKEGEDLTVPLPDVWDLATLKTLPVTLYGSKVSPPCCKIRFMLKYYQVPFTSKEGKKPNSDYKKIPVLDIGDRQINDSYIIVKNLSPILQGRSLTEKEVAMEHSLTFGLMIALEKATATSVGSLCGCGSLLGGCQGCCLRCMAPFIACCIGPKVGKDKDLKSLQDYGDKLRTDLGFMAFFGGEEPSVSDASLYGVLLPFDKAGATCVEVLLGDMEDPLSKWYHRMGEKARGVDIFS